MEAKSQDVSIQVIASPRVSVLIAAYHSGALLARAIESILCQDWPNLELIVCDDGTQDFNATEIRNQLSDIASGNCVCHIIHQPTNVGTVQNLNAGLRQCSGDWIMFLAADDALAGPNTLTTLMRVTTQLNTGWVLGCTMLCDQTLIPTGHLQPTDRELLWIADPKHFFVQLCLRCFLPSSGNLYARELLHRVGDLDEHYRLVEDWPLFLKLAKLGILPQISEAITVLHRAGGFSHREDGRNRIYQADLTAIMRQEILPCLEELDAPINQFIRRYCQDKLDVYRLRFEVGSMWCKIVWLSGHPGLLFRICREKWMKRYDSL